MDSLVSGDHTTPCNERSTHHSPAAVCVHATAPTLLGESTSTASATRAATSTTIATPVGVHLRGLAELVTAVAAHGVAVRIEGLSVGEVG